MLSATLSFTRMSNLIASESVRLTCPIRQRRRPHLQAKAQKLHVSDVCAIKTTPDKSSRFAFQVTTVHVTANDQNPCQRLCLNVRFEVVDGVLLLKFLRELYENFERLGQENSSFVSADKDVVNIQGPKDRRKCLEEMLVRRVRLKVRVARASEVDVSQSTPPCTKNA